MRTVIVILLLVSFLAVPANADQLTAPDPPQDALELMPYETTTFAEGLWHVITAGFRLVYPSLSQCIRVCFCVIAIALLISIVHSIPGNNLPAIELAGTVAVACILLEPVDILIREAADTVIKLSEYGKLLLPVMTGALAAQGGGGSAAALYMGTAAFDAILANTISHMLVPLVYVFVALAVVKAATKAQIVAQLGKGILSAISKGLRIALYLFTGYLTITGVVSGAADQMTVKAAKLTISGMVPVIGNIMADASETILLSAGIFKGAAGVYGMLSVIAVGIVPFLKVGLQYLALKAAGAVCSMVAGKQISGLVGDFASAMGLLLAMTGTMCLLLLISTVCFMKGIG